jgi:hypothetical protein
MRWTVFPIALSLIIPGCKLQTKNARDPIHPSSGDVVISPSASIPITPDVEKAVPVPTAKTIMLDKPSGGSRLLSIPNGCTLIRMYMLATFLEQKLVGNRLIWEMQSNWNQTDILHIHRIVLKGFQN